MDHAKIFASCEVSRFKIYMASHGLKTCGFHWIIPFSWRIFLGRELFVNIYVQRILGYRYISKDKTLTFVLRAKKVYRLANSPQRLTTTGAFTALLEWSVTKAQSWGPDCMEQLLLSVLLWKRFIKPPISTCHHSVPFLTEIYI